MLLKGLARSRLDGIFKPNGGLNFLASSRELYGDEWRRFVWANRKNEDIPIDLSHLSEFQWLLGPVCHSPNAIIKRMNSPAELEIWKLAGNQTASQGFSGSNNMMLQMNTACVGRYFGCILFGYSCSHYLSPILVDTTKADKVGWVVRKPVEYSM